MRPEGVLVLGLDGGTLRVLEPMVQAGLMPTLGRLFERGRVGILRSTLPWYTIPGWTSLMTGVAPGTHGLLHWVAAGPDEYFEDRRPGRRFVTSADIPVPTFWDVAGAAGKRVAVLNMPITYPAWPVNGTMITGLLTPATAREGTCFPPGLLERFPGYRIDLSTSREAAIPDAGPAGSIDRASYLSELVELTKGRARVGEALLGGDVDLGVVVFVGPDRISHRAWPEQERVAAGEEPRDEIARLVAAYYSALDAAISALLEAAGSNVNVVVVADHGFGPPPPSSFAVNAWLRERGYLRLRAPSVQRALARRRALRRLVRPLARRWRRRAGRAEPAVIDWSRSEAYAVGFPHTRMFGLIVNRAGRKRDGSVPPERVPDVLERLEADLRSLVSEDGQPVIRRITSREALEATAPAFPDLLVETHRPFAPSPRLLEGPLFGGFDPSSGLHEPEGVLALAGPRIRGVGPAACDIVDVGPTVLGLLGIAPPAWMEGKARDDLVELSRLAPAPAAIRGPSGTATGITRQQEQEIEEHLRTLGYAE